MAQLRKVVLREERDGSDSRHLWAYLDDEGDLHIDGQDLGPGTAPVSPDGEYEWHQTIRKKDLHRLMLLLGGAAGDDLLDLLGKNWSGPRSGDLEKLLRESGIPTEFSAYSG
ncbi:MAG: hypothetical protein HY928_09865 [Elusimicrobia bacterium]|nr:hypothetical protein [Elusimicrobiota bacterium]